MSKKFRLVVEDLFKLLDGNGNGQLEKKEQNKCKKKLHSMMMPKWRWEFSEMDTDGDGKVSLKEFLAAFEQVHKVTNDQEVFDALMNAFPAHPLVATTQELRAAAERGDVPGMQAAIDCGANVNHRWRKDKDLSHHGDPLLFTLQGGPHIAAAKVLVEAKADLERCWHHCGTPLVWAVKNQKLELVKIFIEAKASPSSCLHGSHGDMRKDGYLTSESALYLAVLQKNEDMVKVLLEAKADTQFGNGNHKKPQTALELAETLQAESIIACFSAAA